MNIFELFGKIAINNTGANQAIDQTGRKANTLASTMGKAFSKVGKLAVDCGKVVAKGLAVGGAAMTGLVVKGMGLAGELEQNMGGSEAVFKEFASTMQKTAAEAYRNMGLSQSDYLATANKMGALFQGVGYSIEDSASITEKAMQRASDVASIMGIDVSTAMESIAGAAKGNFTMMDNLGVAINDTTLKNYALEKGIKKSTAQMSTQEKVALAMELFMEKTAYAAGNYAKENDTLAGSLTTAKAAFQDFLSGAGDADALTEALLNAGDVIIRKADKLLPKLVDGINQLIKNLSPRLPGLIQSVLPGIIDGAVSLLSGLAQAIPGIWSRIVWPAIQNLLKLTLGIELPKWHKLKLEIKVAYDTYIQPIIDWFVETWGAVTTAISDSVTAIGTFFTQTIPTAWENMVTSVETWWNDHIVMPIQNGINAVSSFFTQTIPQAWKDMITSVETWWNDHIIAPIQNAINKIKEFLGIGGESEEHVAGITGTGGNSAGFARSQFQGKGNKQPVVGGNDRTNYVPGHADGLDFVPFDNYLARLHYGETVLTRKDADAWRKGSTGNMAMLSAKFDQMQETFLQVLEGIRNQPIAVNVDSKTAAVLMAREMTKSIGNRNIQSLMAMGG